MGIFSLAARPTLVFISKVGRDLTRVNFRLTQVFSMLTVSHRDHTQLPDQNYYTIGQRIHEQEIRKASTPLIISNSYTTYYFIVYFII